MINFLIGYMRLGLKHIGVYRPLACPLDNAARLSNFLATSLRWELI